MWKPGQSGYQRAHATSATNISTASAMTPFRRWVPSTMAITIPYADVASIVESGVQRGSAVPLMCVEFTAIPSSGNSNGPGPYTGVPMSPV